MRNGKAAAWCLIQQQQLNHKLYLAGYDDTCSRANVDKKLTFTFHPLFFHRPLPLFRCPCHRAFTFRNYFSLVSRELWWHIMIREGREPKGRADDLMVAYLLRIDLALSVVSYSEYSPVCCSFPVLFQDMGSVTKTGITFVIRQSRTNFMRMHKRHQKWAHSSLVTEGRALLLKAAHLTEKKPTQEVCSM